MSRGCRDILFMGPNLGFSVAEQRFEGFCQAMQDHNIDAPQNRHLFCGLNAEDSYRCMNHYLNERKPDAVLCLGGMVAYGAGHAILTRGYDIPEDIMIAEFGDNNIVAQLGAVVHVH
ncbi:MAG: substrate-binding domain-containing protein [candidate division KSB1 bacterium]|nr:substrate-binding domain-containing protein [candidate division KSB1 bacterium]